MGEQQFLSLTADEVLVLTDRVQNHDRGTEDMTCSAYSLLLRLGSAYVEMLGNGKQQGEIPIAVSEAEAWLLRSKITSADKSASDPFFGVKLLTKIYQILLAYNAEIPFPTADDDHDDTFNSQRREAFHQWHDNPDDPSSVRV